MKLGFVGLGKMGSRMALKLVAGGHDVVVWNRSQEAVAALKEEVDRLNSGSGKGDLISAYSVENLSKLLDKPRVVFVMLPAGEVTEKVLSEISGFLVLGDILVDGGNSNFKDTERRYKNYQSKGMKYLGIGVSGGIHALSNGYPMMVGGDESAYIEIGPILDTLAAPSGGHAYFGVGGAGHFVKMVHNGIEYGMMQAIGEGYGVLDKSPYKLDLLEVARLWQRNTIVSGFLNDRAFDALEKDKKLSEIEGVIASSGEGAWTVEQAKDEGVPIENIEQSLRFREKSQSDDYIRNSFAAKMVAALRHEFGGHEVKKK